MQDCTSIGIIQFINTVTNRTGLDLALDEQKESRKVSKILDSKEFFKISRSSCQPINSQDTFIQNTCFSSSSPQEKIYQTLLGTCNGGGEDYLKGWRIFYGIKLDFSNVSCTKKGLLRMHRRTGHKERQTTSNLHEMEQDKALYVKKRVRNTEPDLTVCLQHCAVDEKYLLLVVMA